MLANQEFDFASNKECWEYLNSFKSFERIKRIFQTDIKAPMLSGKLNYTLKTNKNASILGVNKFN